MRPPRPASSFRVSADDTRLCQEEGGGGGGKAVSQRERGQLRCGRVERREWRRQRLRELEGRVDAGSRVNAGSGRVNATVAKYESDWPNAGITDANR